MTGKAVQVRERLRVLRGRRAALEELLEHAQGRERVDLRLERARVVEEMSDLQAELRALTPRHKISRRITGSGYRLDRHQFEEWAREVTTETPDGPTDRERMERALREAAAWLTPKQAEYFSGVRDEKRLAQIAREHGTDRSTVSRTVKRAKGTLERKAKQIFELQKLLQETGEDELRLDMSDPATLKAVMELLTVRQQTYLYLYYGEWLSLREIRDLLGVDSATVLRTIRRAMERLDALMGERTVRVDGFDALEEALAEMFNGLTAEELRKRPSGGQEGSRPAARGREEPEEENGVIRLFQRQEDGRLVCGWCVGGGQSVGYRDPPAEMGSGRLLTLLDGLRERFGVERRSARDFYRRVLYAVARRLRVALAGWKGALDNMHNTNKWKRGGVLETRFQHFAQPGRCAA